MSTFMPARRRIHGLGDFRNTSQWQHALLPAGAAIIAVGVWAACGSVANRANNAVVEIRTTTGIGREASALLTGPTTVEQRYGYFTVFGDVENQSSKTLRNVEAVVEMLDSQRHMLGVESALTEIATLRPGDETPFRVQSRQPAGMAGYRVRFRQLLGPSIASAPR